MQRLFRSLASKVDFKNKHFRRWTAFKEPGSGGPWSLASGRGQLSQRMPASCQPGKARKLRLRAAVLRFPGDWARNWSFVAAGKGHLLQLYGLWARRVSALLVAVAVFAFLVRQKTPKSE